MSEQGRSVTPHSVESTSALRNLQRNAFSAVLAGVALVGLAVGLLRPNAAESPANAAASGRSKGWTELPTVGALSSASDKPVPALRTAQTSGMPATSAAVSDDPVAETPEQTAEDYVRQVEAEPLDPNWAGLAKRTIEEDLRDKGERLGFTTRQVICRTGSCFAEVDFPSQRKARESFKQMFGQPNRLNCPLRLLFQNDGNDSAHALGILIVDCRDKRARDAAGITKD